MGSFHRAFRLRRKLARLAAALFVVLLAGGGGVVRAPRDPDLRTTDCAALRLADEQGRPIVGIEDMATLADGEMLVLSAYDRRAMARALRKGASPPAGGGLYLLDLSQPLGDAMTWRARRLKGALIRRPHGITLVEQGGEVRLFVIERHYRTGTLEADIRQMRLDTRHARLDETQRLAGGVQWCAANDLAFDRRTQALLVTLDHAACAGPHRWWEDLVAAASGKLVRIDLEKDAGQPLASPEEARTVLGSLVWPNGVTFAQGRLWIAETRGRRLRVLDGDDLSPRAVISLRGAPDNLAPLPVTSEGGDHSSPGLLAAVHDSLWRLALFRDHLFGTRRAASRIVRVRPDGRIFTLLADDGSRLSAATTALVAGNRLIAASAWDDRLLVCRLVTQVGDRQT